jgi:AraC-like DNA-binding protein
MPLEVKTDSITGHNAPGRLAPWQVRRVTKHVDVSLEGAIPISELASMSRLSPSYFTRAFRRTLGVSPHRYVITCRIDRAKKLLLESAESLTYIALACGFADQSHMTHRFRRETGLPPGRWRRQRYEPGVDEAGSILKLPDSLAPIRTEADSIKPRVAGATS